VIQPQILDAALAAMLEAAKALEILAMRARLAKVELGLKAKGEIAPGPAICLAIAGQQAQPLC